jgi:predicted nucleic acid-binding protein
MNSEKLKQIKEHTNAIAKLLYSETDSEQVRTLEGIEEAVRKHLIDYVNPEVANFLSPAAAERKQEESEVSKALSAI